MQIENLDKKPRRETYAKEKKSEEEKESGEEEKTLLPLI